LVDDEPYLLNSIQRMSRRSAMTLLQHWVGKPLSIFSKKIRIKYDLIIADLSMPDVSGADLYHFVADKFSGFEQHMIFMTGGAYTAVS